MVVEPLLIFLYGCEKKFMLLFVRQVVDIKLDVCNLVWSKENQNQQNVSFYIYFIAFWTIKVQSLDFNNKIHLLEISRGKDKNMEKNVSAYEHRNLNSRVSTPHNTPIIMGDRHKNFKDPILIC